MREPKCHSLVHYLYYLAAALWELGTNATQWMVPFQGLSFRRRWAGEQHEELIGSHPGCSQKGHCERQGHTYRIRHTQCTVPITPAPQRVGGLTIGSGLPSVSPIYGVLPERITTVSRQEIGNFFDAFSFIFFARSCLSELPPASCL